MDDCRRRKVLVSSELLDRGKHVSVSHRFHNLFRQFSIGTLRAITSAMSRIMVAILFSTLLPSTIYAESAVATTDLELSLESDSLVASPGDLIQVDLILRNNGDFSASGIVIFPVPDGLTLIETMPNTGYVESTGEWQSDEVVSFVGTSIQFTFSVDLVGPANIALVADLQSFVGSFGAYDIDSTPGNNDPCEDDHAEFILPIAGRDFGDAGVPPADCQPPAQPDAGIASDASINPPTRPDAGISDDSSNGGCSTGTGSSSQVVLLLLVLALLCGRRRSHRG